MRWLGNQMRDLYNKFVATFQKWYDGILAKLKEWFDSAFAFIKGIY